MDVISVSQIERNISKLPRKDQLFLIERIIQRLRQKDRSEENNIEKQLTLMASDPNIQEELKKINREFAAAETVVTVVVGTKGENIPRDYPTNVRVSAMEKVENAVR
jgi:short-subunit dehydrogenase